MGKRENRERRLAAAEAEYRAQLIEALKTCAAGQWGLFGANDDILQRNKLIRLRSAAVDGLLQLAEEIEALRAALGYPEGFTLHAELLRLRDLAKSPNAPGEPKLAQAWLRGLLEGSS